MNIIINSRPHQAPDQATLAEILQLLVGDRQKGIAVAVNNQVIPQSMQARHILQPDDNILIIKATQGG